MKTKRRPEKKAKTSGRPITNDDAPPPGSLLLTLRQAAYLLGCSEIQTRVLVTNGKLPNNSFDERIRIPRVAVIKLADGR